ncbi:MAG: suppressor of fused domain protein [Crocinitomicaceae bacterium]|nr:suppressor of fused domain protein [Crocinitomicaceae bacterium]MBK8927614.1 suppressor of fused domain protein [Crocinitomicaceae bacterium]
MSDGISFETLLENSVVVSENNDYHFEIRLYADPNKQYQLLFTNGLRTKAQEVNERNVGFEHIELYMLLPEYWNLQQHSWPQEWLNKIAQIPKKNNTWFGLGDTIPAGNPTKPITEKFKAEYFIIAKPMKLERVLKTKDAGFEFLAVIPIYKKEFQYKTQFSSIVLFEKFQEKNISEMIDEFRLPAARKKFLGVI